MFNPLGFISKFIKSGNQKELDRISKIVKDINAFEEKFKSFSYQNLQTAKEGKVKPPPPNSVMWH